jgi:transposase, IS5 family
MVGPIQRQATLFYLAFGKQAILIKDDLLDPISELLDDPVVVSKVADALSVRSPRSRETGRPGIAPDRLLRCYVLKHLKGWSYRQLTRELRGSLVYRRFTRFDEDGIPEFPTFCRCFGVIGPELTAEIHQHVIQRAQHHRVANGSKLSVDTTVVESNIHHPTDSTLLADGVRVLTRTLRRLSKQCLPGALRVVNRARAVKHRVLEIHRAAKSFTEGSRERLKESYKKLVALTTATVNLAQKTTQDLMTGKLAFVGQSPAQLVAQLGTLEHFVPLIKRVISQTKARVFGGDNHVPDKVVSIFEDHSVPICKGKAHKPTEFGRLVRIDQVENGLVSNYEVADGNPADQTNFRPALLQHQALFNRPPRLATADRGFHSKANERAAEEMGVERVALPARGRLSKVRDKLQHQRWFRRAMKWRGRIEARIGTLKHRFGMARARYKDDRGFKRYVGWSIITHNLVQIARVLTGRKAKQDAAAQKAN